MERAQIRKGSRMILGLGVLVRIYSKTDVTPREAIKFPTGDFLFIFPPPFCLGLLYHKLRFSTRIHVGAAIGRPLPRRMSATADEQHPRVASLALRAIHLLLAPTYKNPHLFRRVRIGIYTVLKESFSPQEIHRP